MPNELNLPVMPQGQMGQESGMDSRNRPYGYIGVSTIWTVSGIVLAACSGGSNSNSSSSSGTSNSGSNSGGPRGPVTPTTQNAPVVTLTGNPDARLDTRDLTETFTVSARDGNASDTITSIQIDNVLLVTSSPRLNSAPDISPGSLAYDAATGRITAETVSSAIDGSFIVGTLTAGALDAALNQTATRDFTLAINESFANAIGNGNEATVTIRFTATDSDNMTSQIATARFTVAGDSGILAAPPAPTQNAPAPAIARPTDSMVDEGSPTNLTATGTFTHGDRDGGVAGDYTYVFASSDGTTGSDGATGIRGVYGDLTWSASATGGTWNYTIDADDARFNDLDEGETATETFTLMSVSDGANITWPTTGNTITITVMGSDEPNNPPTISTTTAPDGIITASSINPHAANRAVVTVTDSDTDQWAYTVTPTTPGISLNGHNVIADPGIWGSFAAGGVIGTLIPEIVSAQTRAFVFNPGQNGLLIPDGRIAALAFSVNVNDGTDDSVMDAEFTFLINPPDTAPPPANTVPAISTTTSPAGEITDSGTTGAANRAIVTGYDLDTGDTLAFSVSVVTTEDITIDVDDNDANMMEIIVGADGIWGNAEDGSIGTLVVSGSGASRTYTFTPNANGLMIADGQSESITFSVNVNDGTDDSAPDTEFTFTVNPPDATGPPDPPVPPDPPPVGNTAPTISTTTLPRGDIVTTTPAAGTNVAVVTTVDPDSSSFTYAVDIANTGISLIGEDVIAIADAWGNAEAGSIGTLTQEGGSGTTRTFTFTPNANGLLLENDFERLALSVSVSDGTDSSVDDAEFTFIVNPL